MTKITFKKDHSIELKIGVFAPRIIGEWTKQDVWAEEGGRRDKSGNKLVHYLFHATLRNGLKLTDFTRDDLEKAIKQYY